MRNFWTGRIRTTSVSAGWLYLFWNYKLAHLKIVIMDSRPPRRQDRTTESLIYHLTSIPAIKFMSKTDLGPVNTSKNTFKSEDFSSFSKNNASTRKF